VTPSETLTAAADLIRDRAAETTKGKWEIGYDHSGRTASEIFRMDPEYPDDPDYSVGLGYFDNPADNTWAALLSPAVAPHLEAILRDGAYLVAWSKSWDALIPGWPVGALARALLGETEETTHE